MTRLLLRGASPGSFDFQKHLRYSLDLKGAGPGAKSAPCVHEAGVFFSTSELLSSRRSFGPGGTRKQRGGAQCHPSAQRVPAEQQLRLRSLGGRQSEAAAAAAGSPEQSY